MIAYAVTAELPFTMEVIYEVAGNSEVTTLNEEIMINTRGLRVTEVLSLTNHRLLIQFLKYIVWQEFSA